ncbi:hypothetical protein BHM03_00036786, partial [Ensete ventricosum]
MSSASSHSESRSVKILAHRSRVLSRPSGDSVSVAVVPSSSALGDSGTADALATIFPTEWTSRTVSSSVSALSANETELVEILRGILSISRGVKDMNKVWLAEAGLSPAPRGIAPVAGVSIEKRPSSGAEAGLRKCLRKVAAEQLADASGSTVMTFVNNCKGTVELEEVPERGYTTRELCEVKDQAGADRYFTSIMTRLECVEGEDPLVPRWSTIFRSSPFWTEGPLSGEYLRGALHPHLGEAMKELGAEIERMQTELESLRSQRRELEQEIGLLRSSLDGARDDQARLEGDVLSLTEVVAFLEAKLKAEGQKVVAAYKASRGFESGLEKIGRVSYEFRYRVVLEQLQRKHPDIMIELDPFAECSEDASVEMDLDQPFDDDTPSEKQAT